jgi:alkylation response protein AidB-like acyl-CoA dehydrogenase
MTNAQFPIPKQALLEVAQSYLSETVAPLASEIDSDPEVLREALRGMGNRALLALKVPQVWGGAGVDELTYRHFQQMVPRYSGALAFLQTQHQSAGAMLASCDRKSLKQHYLPRMGKGEVLVGVGFSQLRRRGEPPVKATVVGDGYCISGTVPWVTGFGFFQAFIVGAALPDGRAVYGVVPFAATVGETGGTITTSEPMQLAAMTSTNTVSVTLNDWFLSPEQVVSIKPAGAIHEKDKQNVLHHGFFALGCARGGLDILAATAQKKQLSFIGEAFVSLEGEWRRARGAMLQALPPASCSFAERLQLRAWAINLAQRCAMAAVTASSGAANYRHHAAQRVYREALAFSVLGQTTAVMEATLARLVSSSQ